MGLSWYDTVGTPCASTDAKAEQAGQARCHRRYRCCGTARGGGGHRADTGGECVRAGERQCRALHVAIGFQLVAHDRLGRGEGRDTHVTRGRVGHGDVAL